MCKCHKKKRYSVARWVMPSERNARGRVTKQPHYRLKVTSQCTECSDVAIVCERETMVWVNAADDRANLDETLRAMLPRGVKAQDVGVCSDETWGCAHMSGDRCEACGET